MNNTSEGIYAVFGKPIGHTLSPKIHGLFAKNTGLRIDYRAIEVNNSLDDSLKKFREATPIGIGANITVPFKEQAAVISDVQHPAVRISGAANTLWWSNIPSSNNKASMHADNTDGIGLIKDLSRLQINIQSENLLMYGAGGAAKGVLYELLKLKPKKVVVVNRTHMKAQELVEKFYPIAHENSVELSTVDLSYLHLTKEKFKLVINATNMGLTDNLLPRISFEVLSNDSFVYDMVYGRDTPLKQWCLENNINFADGLGMLIEQAAESFYIWKGVRPKTRNVLAEIRSGL